MNRLAKLRILKVMHADFVGFAMRSPFAPSILKSSISVRTAVRKSHKAFFFVSTGAFAGMSVDQRGLMTARSKRFGWAGLPVLRIRVRSFCNSANSLSRSSESSSSDSARCLRIAQSRASTCRSASEP